MVAVSSMNCSESLTGPVRRNHKDQEQTMRIRITHLLIITACLISMSSVQAELIRLTEDGTNKRDPCFIDSGKTLIFCFDDGPDLIRMMRMDMESRRVEPVFRDAGNRHNLEPAFSSDGRFVAFTQCTGNLTARLVIRNQETNAEAYVTHSGRGGTRSPAFSPDGKRVVYAFAETGPQQLWAVDTDGKNKKQLTECSGISNWPTFTPDGKTVVFSNSRENNYELYATAVDGSSERRLTHNTIMDIRPAVSPDGKQVAFVSTRAGSYDVFIMNIDGSNVRQMTSSEERDDFPNWHPNGRQIVFVSERGGEFDLYLIDVADGKLAQSD